MVRKLKLRKLGNSVGIILPKALLAHLESRAGDTLLATATSEGVRLTARKSEFAQTFAVFENLSRRYRNTLGKLAK